MGTKEVNFLSRLFGVQLLYIFNILRVFFLSRLFGVQRDADFFKII